MKFDSERCLTAALEACRRAGAIHREHFRTGGLAVERKADASPVTRADRGSEEAIRETLRRAVPELGVLGEELGQEGDERDRWVVDPLDGTRNFIAGLPHFATLIGLELDGELVLGVVHAAALGPGSGVEAAPAAADPAGLGETWCAIRGQGAFGGTGTDPATVRRRRLRVSEVDDLSRAFLVHGGLVHFQKMGLWPAFGELVARAERTRGFGDWWGHVLVAEGRCDAMVEPAVAFHDVAAIRILIEEAGGVFRTRGDVPLGAGFHDATFSSNAALAPALREVLGF
ncbi:MAG TPA: inositol monophosphatase family protein [Thermoanaerobaculia bacterium]|nr:inositol monophosphatase family protein [Thermoanaerobaculia bacterium]